MNPNLISQPNHPDNKKISLNNLSLAQKENQYVKPGAINVIATMPCPLKVPFKQLFVPYALEYNRQHPNKPIHAPDIIDCSPDGLDASLINAKTEEELPDILLTSGFSVVFSSGFYHRFVKTGILCEYTHPSQEGKMPEAVERILQKYKLGALAFSSWSVVQDFSISDSQNRPHKWSDILQERYQGQITVHGCHGKQGSTALLLFLEQHGGKDAIARYARNIIDIRHFAQIIKRMDSSNPLRTTLSLLPDVAASHIPSGKNVKRLQLEEGFPLNPMLLLVKKSKLADCREVLDFMHGKPFKNMLADSGYLMPDLIAWDEKYTLPDFERLANHGIETVTEELESIYQGHLRHTVIDERLKK